MPFGDEAPPPFLGNRFSSPLLVCPIFGRAPSLAYPLRVSYV
jgi:hypothetical protein